MRKRARTDESREIAQRVLLRDRPPPVQPPLHASDRRTPPRPTAPQWFGARVAGDGGPGTAARVANALALLWFLAMVLTRSAKAVALLVVSAFLLLSVGIYGFSPIWNSPPANCSTSALLCAVSGADLVLGSCAMCGVLLHVLCARRRKRLISRHELVTDDEEGKTTTVSNRLLHSRKHGVLFVLSVLSVCAMVALTIYSVSGATRPHISNEARVCFPSPENTTLLGQTIVYVRAAGEHVTDRLPFAMATWMQSAYQYGMRKVVVCTDQATSATVHSVVQSSTVVYKPEVFVMPDHVHGGYPPTQLQLHVLKKMISDASDDDTLRYAFVVDDDTWFDPLRLSCVLEYTWSMSYGIAGRSANGDSLPFNTVLPFVGGPYQLWSTALLTELGAHGFDADSVYRMSKQRSARATSSWPSSDELVIMDAMSVLLAFETTHNPVYTGEARMDPHSEVAFEFTYPNRPLNKYNVSARARVAAWHSVTGCAFVRLQNRDVPTHEDFAAPEDGIDGC